MGAREEFDRCWPWLDASQNCYGKTHGKEDIWRLLANGKAFFWAGERAAVVAELWNAPLMRTMHGWLAGGDLYEIKRKFDSELLGFAKEMDCDRICIQGREQWAKALEGFRPTSVRLVKDLK